MENKEKFVKAEAEEIRFEEDVITESTGNTQTFVGGGQGASGFPVNPPAIPFP